MDSAPIIDTTPALFTQQNAVRLLGVWAAYRLLRVLYNLSPLHPLSRFPGPRLAAATVLYEFWFDMILVGRYTREIGKMHEVYGPIVRISPEELHCDDVDFYDEIYAGGGRRRDKQQHYLNTNTGPTTVSAFGTLDHDLHRLRRAAMNKFFSRAQIGRLEPEINALTQRLCDKFLRMTGRTFDVTTAYSCLTTDVISEYCFGEPMGFLAQDGWEPNFRGPMNAFLSTAFLFRYFPLTRALANAAPFLAKFMGDDVALLMQEIHVNTPNRIRQARKSHETGKAWGRSVIYSDILDSSLPASEKTVGLSGEGFSLVGAGTETTAWTLTIITFYLLSQPSTLASLAAALQDLDPANLSWPALEKIPYLRAVVLEGLRLSYGVASRSPRVAQDEALVYRGHRGGRDFEYVIPKGAAIGMSAALMHHDEAIFPDSHAFKPERWLDDQARGRKNLASFSRGSRQCLGIHLAECELYMGTAALTLRVFPRMRLFETTAADVEYDHDMITAQPKRGSKGVRVTML